MTRGQMTRRSFTVAMGLGLLSLAACGGSSDGGSKAASGSGAATKVEMVTNVGGINDQGFCQLSWDGLQSLQASGDYEVSYIESKQDADYVTNLDKAIDDGSEFVWAIGFAMADAIANAAKTNPDVKFGIVDANSDGSSNLTGVLFAAQEPSFVVGYIAGKTTQTNKVGFVGGIKSDNIDGFEYGYMAGVAYAAKELGKDIKVDSQYAESFTDSAKGKSIAQKMYADGADIVYHAAGSTGIGVIEAASEANKFAIGVDMDQSFLAPENVLTSAIKRVDVAIADLTPKLISGEIEGGTDVVLTMSEGDYLGIPEEHSLMPDGVYEDALVVMDAIKAGDIVAPANQKEYKDYTAKL